MYWNIGKKLSEKTKNKMSESHKDIIISIKTRKKISDKLKGIIKELPAKNYGI